MQKTFAALTVLCLGAACAFAQSALTGRILDSKGEPVVGAVVQVEGSSVYCVADFDGNYSIKASVGQTLVYSSLGFVSQSVVFRNQKTLDVTLETEVNALDEVVVVGYGSIKKKEMTSAVAHVSSKDLAKVSTLDTKMLLQGKVPGVSVTNASLGDPNSQGNVQIRGVASRSAGNAPLYVIDGVPGADMTNINPSDIESIDVLKDGAASAIYGTRGGNGVIIVNLRKGSKDGNVHTSYSASATLNVPKRELVMLNGDQYRAYRCYDNPADNGGASTDWFKEATRLGKQQMHTLSISGGNAATNYRVTADFRDANGIDLRSTRREYGARATVSHTTKGGLLTFKANIVPRVIDRDLSVGLDNIIKNNPTYPVLDETSPDGYFAFPLTSPGSNLVETARMCKSETEIKLLEWNISGILNLLPLFSPSKKNLELTSQVTLSNHEVDKFYGSFTPSTYSSMVYSSITGEASRQFDKSSSYNAEWVTNFSGKFGDHQVRAMAGYSYYYGSSSGMAADNKNFSSDAITFNNLGSGLYANEEGRINMSSSKSDNKLISFFARVNYDWKERYLFTASIRHEGSSRFGVNHKWGNFPAVSAGWRISSEPFMKGTEDWLDDLKFRYDYGVTGNQDFGNYLSLSTYRAYGYYQYQGQTFKVWGPDGNTNTELRWEKGHNQNIGLDFSLFKYRITGSFNYYHRKQVDLLGDYDVAVPPNLSSSIFANVGTMRNQGFEFDVTFDLVRKEGFDWSMTVLGATNDNKFLSFSNEAYTGKSYYNVCTMANPNNPGYLQRIEEGKRVGNYFTYRYAGVDSEGDWLIYDRYDNVIPIANGTDEDKTITGNGLPWFTGSIVNNFRIGGFDLSFTLRAAAGFEIFNVHDFYYGLQDMQSNVLRSAYSRNAHITKGRNVITDYFLEPGDYIKLDNVSVGYQFKLNRKFIDSVKVFANANNVYTLTRFTGIDPSNYEVNGLTPGTFGGNASYYPSVFQMVFGLQVDF